MTNQCREEFEKREGLRLGDLMLYREGDGYWYPHMQDRWQLWQSAWKAAKQTKPDTIFQCDDAPINKAYEG